VFASGRGSNLGAILEAIDRGELDAQVKLVVSDRPEPGAFEIARRYHVPTCSLSPKSFPTESEYVDTLLKTLAEHDVDFIALAGYLKMIPAEVVRAYRSRIVNIHPALLPAFGGKGMYGRRVHEAVIEYGCKVTGVTVHVVDESYDTGPPVVQECVRVEEDDDAESLAARVLEVEHRVYPQALQLFAEGRVEIRGRRVRIRGQREF
jgi:phosphoribosylglycinamide formyltransferase-1